MSRTNPQHFTFDWHGITLSVSYVPDWLGGIASAEGLDVVHLEIRAIKPDKAPLPITETGYRSHFTNSEVVGHYGGPEGFVKAWLNAEAKKPAWKNRQPDQLSLF